MNTLPTLIPEAARMLDNIRRKYSRLAVLTCREEQAMDSGDQYKIFKYNKERQQAWDELIDLGWELVVILHWESEVQASEISVLEFLEGRFQLA